MTTRRTYPADWAEIARRIKEEANWTCEVCGLRFAPTGWALEDQPGAHCGGDLRLQKIGVHHIDDNTFNNDPNNLLPCCQTCHLSVEAWKPGFGIPSHWDYERWAWIRRRGLSYQWMIQKGLFDLV